jgi:hypothetical protein
VNERSFLLGGLLAFAILLVGVGGFAIGRAQVPSEAELETARQTALVAAADAAEVEAFERAKVAAREDGDDTGRRSGAQDGSMAGAQAGQDEVDAELVAEAPAGNEPASAPGAGLEYTDQLPHGRPGYVLPEEERSLACVGIDAETGECVGD